MICGDIMIKYIFKSVGGSFCSTLGRIICYILLGLIVAFLLSERASALTIENDSYLKYVDIRSNTDYSSNITGNANYDSGTVYFTCDYIANSYGCGVQFHTKEELDLIKGRSYTFSLDIGVTNARLVKSTADKGEYFGLRSVSSTPDYLSAYDYWFNTLISDLPYKIDNVHIEYVNDSSQIITFSFTMLENVSNASIFFFPFGLNKTGIYASTIFELNYLAIDSTNDDVINSLEEQSQEIIRNQNENNEKVLNAIDRVNDNFNSCRDSYNLLHIYWNKGYSYTSNGITYTVNDDYSITINGTATANSFFNLNMASGYENDIISGKTYYLSTGIAVDGLSFALRDTNGNALIYLSNQSSKSWKSTYTGKGTTYIRITNGTTINNLKVYPMLTEGQPITDYEEYGKEICTNKLDDLNETNKGIFSTLGNILSFINPLSENFFAYKLIDLLIDALKSLFVPTNDQLYEIVNDSKNLSENFGFVGQSMNFFINIFTSLLGLVNSNGCLELPEFTIGATSLFDSITFWEARQVCLSDNVILNSNISTIRTITSIVLVGLFINFAVRQFFGILNKNDSSSPGINDNVSLRSDKS